MLTYIVQIAPKPPIEGMDWHDRQKASRHMPEDIVEADIFDIDSDGVLVFSNRDTPRGKDYFVNIRAYAPGVWREVRVKVPVEPVAPMGVITEAEAAI